MLTAIRNLFRPNYRAAVDAAESETVVVPTLALQERHAALLARATAKGLDPQTLLLLIQVFGPLVVALVERWLARRA